MKSIVGSAVHPDTGEIIPFPMRLCAFVPMNIPIIVGILLAPPTAFNAAFFQWVNQSYNAGLNFGNRNATTGQTTTDVLRGYCAAVTSGISMGLLVRKILSPFSKGATGSRLLVVNGLVGYSGAAVAGFLNSYCMRMSELEKGRYQSV